MSANELATLLNDNNYLDRLANVEYLVNRILSGEISIQKLSNLGTDLQGVRMGRVQDYDGNEGEIVLAERHMFTPPQITLSPVVGGALDIGETYYYAVTFIDQYGETLLGISDSRTTGAPTRTIGLSNIPTGPWGTAARRLYRSQFSTGSINYNLLAILEDNTTTTYTDDGTVTPTSEIPPSMDGSYSRPTLPRSAIKFFDEFTVKTNAGVAVTTVMTNTGSQVRYGFYGGPAAADANDLDHYACEMWLEAGTYTIKFYGIRGTSSGIIDLYVDGVEASTGHDLYNGSADYDYTFSVADVAVTTNGYHLVEWVVNSKNGSSSDYRVLMTYTSAVQATL
jgi:hypothetical protein